MLDDIQNACLQDMYDSACAIRKYLDGVSRDMFLDNQEKQDAVLRRFEIIGEAAGRLSAQTREQFPAIPFKNIRGMRNIIAHNYGDVDVQQVWQTATNDLDSLIDTLSAYFNSL